MSSSVAVARESGVSVRLFTLTTGAKLIAKVRRTNHIVGSRLYADRANLSLVSLPPRCLGTVLRYQMKRITSAGGASQASAAEARTK